MRSCVKRWWMAWGSHSTSPYPWSSSTPVSKLSLRRSAPPGFSWLSMKARLAPARKFAAKASQTSSFRNRCLSVINSIFICLSVCVWSAQCERSPSPLGHNPPTPQSTDSQPALSDISATTPTAPAPTPKRRRHPDMDCISYHSQSLRRSTRSTSGGDRPPEGSTGGNISWNHPEVLRILKHYRVVFCFTCHVCDFLYLMINLMCVIIRWRQCHSVPTA